MIKAIIFDCFGVLVRDGWLPFCEKHFGNNKVLMQQAYDSNQRVNRGLISFGDYIRDMANLAGVSENEAQHDITSNPPNDELFNWIQGDLKPKYKIGLLSNAGDNWLNELFTPLQVALFDEVVLSYQLGVVKPDPIMYQTIAQRLGLTVEECLLVDDQERYCEGARIVGMQAIHYVDNRIISDIFNKININT